MILNTAISQTFAFTTDCLQSNALAILRGKSGDVTEQPCSNPPTYASDNFGTVGLLPNVTLTDTMIDGYTVDATTYTTPF